MTGCVVDPLLLPMGLRRKSVDSTRGRDGMMMMMMMMMMMDVFLVVIGTDFSTTPMMSMIRKFYVGCGMSTVRWMMIVT